MADAPTFDPSKPFEPVAAPAFDASKPYEAVETPKTTAGQAALEGALKGASANFRDEIYGASKASGLPDYLGGFRAPIGAARLAYEHFTGEPGEASSEYDAAVKSIRERQALLQKEHPTASMAGELGGSAAGMMMLPVGAVARGAGMGAKALQGAKLGAGYGALAGAGEGEDLASRGLGAATGAVTGGAGGALAAPVAAGLEKGIGAAYNATVKPLVATGRGWLDPTAEAARRASGAISRDYEQVAGGNAIGMTPTEFAAAKAAGNPVINADMGGETTRALLRSAANTSPEGRATVEGVLSDRFKGQTERTATDIRNLVSGGANATKTRAELLAEYDAKRIPAYKEAFAKPAAQNLWDEGFEQISQAPSVQEAIRGAMVNAKDQAAKIGLTPSKSPFIVDANGRFTLGTNPDDSKLTPNLQFWDSVKKNLDNIGTRESQFWSKTLRDRIDDLVPEYANARGVAAKYFGGNNAIEAGENSMKFTGNPSVLSQQMAKMSPAERELFREGRASAWADRVLNMADNVDVTKRIYNSPNDRARAAAVFGESNLGKVETRLQVETVMDAARKALGNSTTVRQMIEAGLAGGGIGAYLDGWRGAVEGAGAGAAAAKTGALNLARSGAQKVIGYVDQNTARKVAELLTSDNPGDLMKGVHMAIRHKNVADGLKAIGDRLTVGAGSRGASMVPRAIQGPIPVAAQGEQQ